jgi:hypothetical protein
MMVGAARGRMRRNLAVDDTSISPTAAFELNRLPAAAK